MAQFIVNKSFAHPKKVTAELYRYDQHFVTFYDVANNAVASFAVGIVQTINKVDDETA